MADDMTNDSTKMLPADDTQELEAGEAVESLEAGDDTDALPDGYEIVATDEATVEDNVEQAEQFGEALTSLQNIIQRYSDQYDQVNSRYKDLREMMKNMFDNDAELQELSEQAKTAQQDAKMRKQRIKESPESVELQMKMKETKEEINEIQETLNNHLLRYYQMTGSQVIEEPDGTEREFKISARLKSKKAS
ncbi:hypothetical protein LRY65_05680 [Candidatus Woesebacteria bacterium]|nr:hypothetical protein [Candidatus Woesebacteria bacterium]MCD8506750.1 hypothetical protein [Candidatus Woesebacteria bacterium]MCD8527658.1 hypothetical protein [Candidatus Woesebacteria bacterium]MCD8546372.1 hypothetical protein [Candidatus Woesebacteria bacterium]